jgi:protein-disulfide isomerase
MRRGTATPIFKPASIGNKTAMTMTFPKLAAAFVCLLAVATGAAAPGIARADDDVLSRDAVWQDPEIPALGNPNGDLVVVEYFDYRCPVCKAVHPHLARAIKQDGKVRLISRNWPIFGGVSIYAARMVLAAKYQGKFAEAHEALFTSKSALSESVVHDLLTKAGIDAAKAADDLEANRKTIDATLARNEVQASAFGFNATPAFVVGPFRVSSGLDADGFKQVFADARARQAKKPR